MFRKHFWLILTLVAVGFFVYFFNLQNPLFWDDDDWIINNSSVHNITWNNVKFWFTHNTLAGVGLKSNYYRPFLFFTFAANYMIAGIKPLLWHLTSNLIHIANGILVFSILYLVFRKRLVAFLVSLIFTIHPLQTEAVTYISGRGDLLVVFFMFLALWLLVKIRKVSSYKFQVLSLILLVLALLSRETAIIFPFLAMLVLITLSQDKFLASFKKTLKATTPFFGIVIVYGILRLTAFNFQNTLNFYPVANVYSESFIVRLYTFGGVLIDYVRLLFAPVGLHMERSVTVYTSLFQWPIYLVFLTLVGLVVFLFYLYKREIRNGRLKFPISNSQFPIKSQSQNAQKENPKEGWKLEIGYWKFSEISDFRVWFFGLGWFFIGLVPVSGITPINAVMYEHWLYLPMIGFWFIVVFYLVKLFDYFKSKSFNTYYIILTAALVVYAAFFAYQSIQRNILWGKPVEFYQNILIYEPQSARINNNLGNLYYNEGNTEKAKQFYQQSAENDDTFPQPHYNLGSILESEGDVFGAVKRYEKAIEIDPDFYYPYQNLLAIYANRGEFVKAAGYAETLKRLKSYDPRVFYNSALISLALGKTEEAINDLKQGLKVVGSDAEAGTLINELLKKIAKK